MTASMDTMTMIWGMQQLKKKPTPAELNMLRRAAILLAELEEANEQIVVPAVVVTELLCGVPCQKHGAFVAELQRRFFCPPFDIRASVLAAELWQRQKAAPKSQQIHRPLLKLDVMIVATAKIAGAAVFYSNDKKCRALAEAAGLDAHDLPAHSQNLFTEAEINRRFGSAET